ncbi:hypothetical protein TSUD_119740 [Trifolium subterraneum]|uniref:Uncharacterized protein n=1 Tax=Trifolium subterraneum TaxID=3900 RepID=A0A2Z6N225_TRISU|nr:hypothetical protein TSUD_119740 [Trifolium subterraneum]
MVFSLAFCIFTSDMCMKLQGKELDGACRSDGQCQSGCPVGKHGVCEHGRCWCYDPPSTRGCKRT